MESYASFVFGLLLGSTSICFERPSHRIGRSVAVDGAIVGWSTESGALHKLCLVASQLHMERFCI